jgi:hypothetical protein
MLAMRGAEAPFEHCPRCAARRRVASGMFVSQDHRPAGMGGASRSRPADVAAHGVAAIEASPRGLIGGRHAAG